MSEELKRCPFCGGEAFLWDEREFHDHKGWFAMCGDCDASGDTKPTQAEAIAAWNTRTGQLVPVPSVERVESQQKPCKNCGFLPDSAD